ncbi:MAG: ECF RNA polymerase sigma factor SigW [Turneriella sp.]|nr:ECF RNA polymerase sigma factor SigW [Turneriella sp.]
MYGDGNALSDNHFTPHNFSKEDFDREFEKALGMIYSIGLKLYRGNEEDAADFSQSLYLFALKKIQKFEGRSTFSTWLYRLAWNFGLEDLRRKKRLVTEDIADFDIATNDAHEPEFSETEIDALRQQIAELPDMYRLPIIMFFFENMSYSEISAITQIKEGTLKANVHRAKNILRQNLGK